MQKLLICPIHFQNSKDCKKEQEKKADRSVLHFENFSVEMWLKFETAQRLHFQIPHLFWATSFYLYNFRIRMPLLTKESGKVKGI